MILKMVTRIRLMSFTGFTRTFISLAVLSTVFIATGVTTAAQQKQPVVIVEPDKSRLDESHPPFSEIEEEMRAKRAIKYADKEYQENLGRARDLSVLGAAIVSSFKQKSALSLEDLKKLEKVEKLAKGIRRAAGGSDDDTQIEKPPADIAAAVEMLGELSNSLKAKVEKTPKRVISAAVIDEANVLLELIRLLRILPSKA